MCAKSYGQRLHERSDISEKNRQVIKQNVIDKFPRQREFIRDSLGWNGFSEIAPEVEDVIHGANISLANENLPPSFKIRAPDFGTGKETLDPYVDMALDKRNKESTKKFLSHFGLSPAEPVEDYFRVGEKQEVSDVRGKSSFLSHFGLDNANKKPVFGNEFMSYFAPASENKFLSYFAGSDPKGDYEETAFDHAAHATDIVKNPVGTLAKDFDYLGTMNSHLSDYADLNWKDIPFLRRFGSYEGNVSDNRSLGKKVSSLVTPNSDRELKLYTSLRDREHQQDGGIRINEDSSVSDLGDAGKSLLAGLVSFYGRMNGGLAYGLHALDRAGDNAIDWEKQEFAGLNQELPEKEKTGYRKRGFDLEAASARKYAEEMRNSVKNPDSALNKAANFVGGYVPNYALMAMTGGTSIPAHIASTALGSGLQSLASAGDVYQQMIPNGADHDTSLNAAGKSFEANALVNAALEGLGGPHGLLTKGLVSKAPVIRNAFGKLYGFKRALNNSVPYSVYGLQFPHIGSEALKYASTIPVAGFKSALQALAGNEIDRASMETANDGYAKLFDSIWNKSEPTYEKFKNVALPAFIGGAAINAFSRFPQFVKDYKAAQYADNYNDEFRAAMRDPETAARYRSGEFNTSYQDSNGVDLSELFEKTGGKRSFWHGLFNAESDRGKSGAIQVYRDSKSHALSPKVVQQGKISAQNNQSKALQETPGAMDFVHDQVLNLNSMSPEQRNAWLKKNDRPSLWDFKNSQIDHHPAPSPAELARREKISAQSKSYTQQHDYEILSKLTGGLDFERKLAERLNQTSPENRKLFFDKYNNPTRADTVDPDIRAWLTSLPPEQKRIQIEKLKNAESISIRGDEIPVGATPKETRQNARTAGLALRGQYKNNDTGSSINVSRKSVLETLGHGMSDNAHVQSISAIPEIIKKSVYVDSRPNEDFAKNPEVAKYDYFVSGMNIGNEPYTVKAVIAQDNNGNRYYDHKLTQIEKGKLLASTPDNDSGGNKKLAFLDDNDKRLLAILQVPKSDLPVKQVPYEAVDLVRKALEKKPYSVEEDYKWRYVQQNKAQHAPYVREGRARHANQ